jgi:predicted AAA+ superfamily ATPase
VYKDIPQVFNVERPLLLERLLYTLAGQVTGLLSPSGIGQALDGMSQPTFDRYLSYLERAFLVFTLPNYSGSEAQRQRRGRKIYFVDGAVRNAALQRGIAPLSDHAEMGLLLENLAASHLHALGQQSQVRTYHWRDRNDEVDLVYDHPELPLAFEVGSSHRHSREGMRKFLTRFPRFRGRCYIVTPDGMPLHPNAAPDGIGSLPLDMMLVAIGAQAEHELERRLAV